jgi:hydrogenase expression/formation protein HypE
MKVPLNNMSHRSLTSSQPASSRAKPHFGSTIKDQRITLAHGSGGKAMRDLIQNLLVPTFNNPILQQLEDQATIPLKELLQHGDRLAFTTDSYVVDPLFFPGGNIGELAVNGTVNDLAVSGACPFFLSCGLVIEEGFSLETLTQIVQSMKHAADGAGVSIVTGDTKVVEKGSADKLFINTAGIGVIREGVSIGATKAQPGDAIITNGFIGDHGVAIILARNELALEANVQSDTQPVHDLVSHMLDVCSHIHCLRDATRGGLATVLNEFASASNVSIQIKEPHLPIRESVRGACEILGLDPLYLANEGKIVAAVPSENAHELVDAMREHPMGKDSAIIGSVKASPAGTVMLSTTFGGTRIVDTLVGDQLPRIC